jgi:hypothetical protein
MKMVVFEKEMRYSLEKIPSKRLDKNARRGIIKMYICAILSGIKGQYGKISSGFKTAKVTIWNVVAQ